MSDYISITREINVDLYEKKSIIIDAKQYDKNSRFILINCYNQKSKIFLPQTYKVFIRYRKSDGKGVFNSCIINEKGQILIELTEQMLASEGSCFADVIILDANGEVSDEGDITSDMILSTMNFCINVIRVPLDNEVIESSSEYSALNELIIKATKDYSDIVEESENYSIASKSYAVGDTGSRQGEDMDNSKYYYLLAKDKAESIQGALLPMGTVTFENLNNQEKEIGYMYNISNDFITDNTFKEGANIPHSAGTNVYYTADGYWDCLASPLVYGVKGNEESIYRKGNVNITPSNIGVYSMNDADETFMLKENAVGQGSFSINRERTSVIGSNSIVLGSQSEATGNSAIAIGSLAIAEGNKSITIGTDAFSSATDSIAIGRGSTSKKNQAIALCGATINNTDDFSFAIGNSNSTNLNNILELYPSGKLSLHDENNNYVAPVNDIDVVTKKYVDDLYTFATDAEVQEALGLS